MVNRFFSNIERIEADFRYLAVYSNINYFLATLLLKDLSEYETVNEIEKRYIEDLIETKDDISILSEFKKQCKRIKIESKREVVKTDCDNENESKTYFVQNNERSRYGSWENSLGTLGTIPELTPTTGGQNLKTGGGI